MTLGSTKPNSSRSMVVELPLDTTALVDKMSKPCHPTNSAQEMAETLHCQPYVPPRPSAWQTLSAATT
jgi:hypothetical protein